MGMTLDQRLEALAQSLELLGSLQKDTERHLEEMRKMVAKHEQWQQKVERSLVAGIEAALREWRNGEQRQ